MMKTLAASIAMLLLVISGGLLITREQPQPKRTLPVEPPETDTQISPESTRASEWGEELPEHYQVIIDNNLFRPLGWKPEPKSDVPFHLVGTILIDERNHYQAVLKAVDTQQIHFVTLDDVSQNGWCLVMIAPKQVVLEKDNRRITLGLNEQHLFISPHPR